MVVVTVLYPKTATSHFNYDYFVTKHIPLVQTRWPGMGMTRAEFLRGTTTLEGGPPAFALMATLVFASQAEMQEALAAHGAEIMGDIPNYTDVQPLIQVNEPL
jgi:uncharacterized protein (TIGR02118 family)